MKELFEQEVRIAQESFGSALPFQEVSKYISFPKDVKGLTIVGIGECASTATLELRKQRAKAIAVDYRYDNLEQVASSMERLFSSKKIYQNDRFQLARKYIESSRKTKDEFLRAYRNREIQLVAAIAGNLPFRDETVDFAFSMQCIGEYFIKDKDIFIHAISESIRVLKPGCQLQVYPWPNMATYAGDEKKRNSVDGLITYLENHGIPYFVEKIESEKPIFHRRLRIIKPDSGP